MNGRFFSLCVLGLLLINLFSTLGVAGIVAAPKEQAKSIGGREHEDSILGVRIGMSVQTALETVFVNANRKPGQEKPDALRHEGKGDKDIRVLYKNLKEGELQIVFADGKFVKEIILDYATRPHADDLRLPRTSSIGQAMTGERFDDRYTVGFSNDKKTEYFWWRDDKTAEGYRVRVGFISRKITEEPSLEDKTIARKVISITPGDEEKFLKVNSSR